MGPKEGLLVLAAAAGIMMLVLMVLRIDPAFALLTVPLWMAVCMASVVLRTTASQGVMLVSIAMLVGLAVVAAYISLGDLADWFEHKVTENPDVLKAVPESALTDEQLRNVLRRFPIALTMVATFATAIATLLGRWWQSLLYNRGAFREEFHSLRLPKAVVLVFSALLLVEVFGADAGQDVVGLLLAVTTVLYVFQGLAVLHFQTLTRGLNEYWLAGVYLFLFVAGQLTLPLLILTGIVDAMFDLRRGAKT